MINNKKFDEALEFAEKNNLNKQLVLKPKLTDQLERINSSPDESYDIQQIIEDLSRMDDFNFVLRYCLDLKLSTYDDTLAILNFANQLIQNSNADPTDDNNDEIYKEKQTEDNNDTKTEDNNQNDITTSTTTINTTTTATTTTTTTNNNNNNDKNSKFRDKELILKVQQAIKRLGTYVLVKKESNLTKGILFNSKEWQTFKDSDIIDDIKQIFYYGKISLGIIIWRRHLIGEFDMYIYIIL